MTVSFALSSYRFHSFFSTQISEKQKSLYEALERQQHYQESLQSISTKMESIEGTLNEGLEPNKSPESQMAAHQVSKRWRSEDSEEMCDGNKTSELFVCVTENLLSCCKSCTPKYYSASKLC